MLRKLKLTYIIYNIFNRRRLTHNLKLYQKIGLKKIYFSPISSKDFKKIDKNLLKEKESVLKVEDTALFKTLDTQSQQSV